MVRRVVVTIVLLFAAPGAFAANQLIVDARTLRPTDMATVTVMLEGEFAEVESVSPPLQNLTIVGEPWVSSEFAFLNGRVSRRKVFRFRVRPVAPGRAMVGPMVLRGDAGGTDTLPQVVLTVEPFRGLGSNDPESLLRDLTSSGRDALFVAAEVERNEVFVGEPVRVTWFLYNGVTIQEWQVTDVPKLRDFWAEEIPVRNEPAERVFVRQRLLQRVPVRRVVLYPLRSGTLRVDGMTIEAQFLRPVRNPFWYEGEMARTTFFSAPITIAAKPLPPGPPVDAVGDLRLECEQPRQVNAGPVVIDVTLGGEANLRGVPAPRFAETIAGEVQVEAGQVTASREELSVAMSRRWRYLVFPSKEGLLYVPPLTLRTFVPSTGTRKELQCSAATIEAQAMAMPVTPAPGGQTAPNARRALLPWVLGGTFALLFAAAAIPRLLRERAFRREVRAIVEGRPAAEIREAVDARVSPRVMTEASDRGEAYRSLRSLLDAAERERDIAANSEGEIERRVRELLRLVR